MQKGRRRRNWNLYFIVGLVILGLIGVQFYWMNTTVRLQQLAAERSLKNDLGKVISEVEENAYCFFYYSKAYIKKDEGIYLIKQSTKDDQFIGPPYGYIDTMSMYNLFYFKKDTFFDKNNSITFQMPATVDISLKFKFAVPGAHVRIDTNAYKLPNINMANFRQSLNNSQTLDGLINTVDLDSMIKETLKKNDFDTVYQLGLKRVGSPGYEYLKAGSSPAMLAKADINMSLLGDNFNKPYILSLYLPDRMGRAIRSMGLVMICSIAIILVLIISYAYFVRTILNQKKLSEMKSMFINNITHEFNTPITNINLAIENWKNSPDNAGFYTSIIEEENNHMQKNVEQMLQLATMEHSTNGDFTERIDLNELVTETVNAFRIQLDAIKGNVEYDFAGGVRMYGNRHLIKNLLYNLIDNSIKYRSGGLLIKISTFQSADKVGMVLQDNGIGMAPETMKYMYERFYRGVTGDKHDVKGFGIGLSYVKHIVDAHKGSIQVKSRKNEGTKFTISFPKTLNA